MNRSATKTLRKRRGTGPDEGGPEGLATPLRAMFENSLDAIVLGAADGRVLDANPAVSAVFGYTGDELRALGPDAPLDSSDPRVAAALEERRLTGRFRGVLPCRRKDGGTLHAEVSTFRFADASGRQWCGTCLRDITERERHEDERERLLAEIRSKELRLEAIVEQMPVAVFIVESDGRATLNSHAQALLGIRLEAGTRTTRHVTRVLHPDGTPVPIPELPSVRVLRDGAVVPTAEYLIERPDGTRVPVLGSASPIRDAEGRTVAGVGVCQDIGEYKRIEQALVASERLLSRTFELLPMAVWITDRTGTIVRVNSAGLRIWGGARWVGPEEYGQYRGWWADTGEAIEPDQWAIARALNRGETSLGEVLRIQCFDGSVKTIINSAIPLYDELGDIAGAVGVNEDITGLKETEDALKRTVEWREHVLGIVAHDLRNPLQSILLHLRLLLRIGERRDEQHQTLLDMFRRAKQMARLVQDLLDATRLEAGALVIDRTPIDAAELLDRAFRDCQLLAIHAGVELRREPPAGPAVVRADPDRILQVLDNLIGNALKFTHAGGAVVLGAQRREGEVVFSVADSGVGMSPDELDRMFERLWQAKSDRRGLGLGLGIAKAIVDAHGGRIWADSAPGRGTTVRFALPLVGPAA